MRKTLLCDSHASIHRKNTQKSHRTNSPGSVGLLSCCTGSVTSNVAGSQGRPSQPPRVWEIVSALPGVTWMESDLRGFRCRLLKTSTLCEKTPACPYARPQAPAPAQTYSVP